MDTTQTLTAKQRASMDANMAAIHLQTKPLARQPEDVTVVRLVEPALDRRINESLKGWGEDWELADIRFVVYEDVEVANLILRAKIYAEPDDDLDDEDEGERLYDGD